MLKSIALFIIALDQQNLKTNLIICKSIYFDPFKFQIDMLYMKENMFFSVLDESDEQKFETCIVYLLHKVYFSLTYWVSFCALSSNIKNSRYENIKPHITDENRNIDVLQNLLIVYKLISKVYYQSVVVLKMYEIGK